MLSGKTYHFNVKDVVLTLMDDDIILTVKGEPTDISDQMDLGPGPDDDFEVTLTPMYPGKE